MLEELVGGLFTSIVAVWPLVVVVYSGLGRKDK